VKAKKKSKKRPARKTSVKGKSMGIVAVGSMAFDSIETPFGKVAKVLGGSANYFSLSASYFTKVHCVSVVGQDYPADHLKLLQDRGINTAGIKMESGRTFHWSGAYSYDMNEAKTLATELNVFEAFSPELPSEYKDTEYVFLGNISPDLQLKVLDQVKNPRFVAIDTMNFWISGAKDTLIKAISRCDALIINEGEIRQLTQQHNLIAAAQLIHQWGPQTVVVKRGEYGAVLFHNGKVFSIPGLPLAEVKDPTGAGDTFAGGFMGFIASKGSDKINESLLRQAVVFGNVMASFTVQDFGFANLLHLTPGEIEARFHKFVDLTTFSATAFSRS